jgi:sec-independent protein translocase protein TatC
MVPQLRADPAAARPGLPVAGLLHAARRGLTRIALVLVASFLLAFAFSQELLVVLAQPLVDAWERHRAALGAPSLHFSGLVEPFWVSMTLAFWIGLLLSAPFILQQLWSFLTRTRPSQRKLGAPFAASAIVFFAGGAVFCYFVVMPLAFDFFLGHADQNLASMRRALEIEYEVGLGLALRPALYLEPYLAITIRILLAFGLVFELPIAIFFLSSVGLVTHRGMWRFNRWAVVLAFVIAALLTPGPDVVSQVAMAVPLIALYNLSIGIAFVMTRRRQRAAADG